MALSPSFASPQLAAPTTLDASTHQDTSRSTPSASLTAVTGGSSGSLVKSIHIKARGRVDAEIIRIFHKTGSTYALIDEILVPGEDQLGPNTKTWSTTWSWSGRGFHLPSSDTIEITHTVNTNDYTIAPSVEDL